MRPALVDAIRVPFWSGVRPNERGTPLRLFAAGFDFETVKGIPCALGWRDDSGERQVYGVTARSALPRLLSLVRRAMMRHEKPVVLACAHVLRYDLGVILYPWLTAWNQFTARQGVLDIPFGEMRGELAYYFGRVVFARFTFAKRTAMLIDTFRYFTMSLDRAAEAVGLAQHKLEKPSGLGERRIPLADLREYLLRDTDLVHALGRKVIEWHKSRDLRPSVSVPQLASRVLCHGYVKRRWLETPSNIRRAALLAYHAGRNGLYVAPGWRRVKLLDLNSAYPWAMTRLPCFSTGRWSWTRTVESPWGFYYLYRGEVRQRPYPILFDHGFKPLPDGPVRAPVWTTGMELSAAIRAGCIQDARAVGYVWQTDGTDRPLRDFVRDMYAKRRAATSPENRLLYKLMMNSLYGKFISRIETVLPEATEHRAGALFYPVAASWITALVRVKLWEMERHAGAFHSATDGLMVPPDFPLTSTARLGGWKVEGEGWALILRNKFYLVFSDEGRLVKCAYHGFDGTTPEVVRMLRDGASTYRVDRLRGWLESAARGVRPFVSEHRTFRVTCPMTGYWPPPIPLVDVPAGHGWRSVPYSRDEWAADHSPIEKKGVSHGAGKETKTVVRRSNGRQRVRLQVGAVRLEPLASG